MRKTVAIKRILRRYGNDPYFVHMMVDEAKISVLLNHPNIAQIYELGEYHGDHFIAMEYVSGHPLSSLMKHMAQGGARLGVFESVFICREMLEGLHAAHTQKDSPGKSVGIIHRDVSPQNLLLSWDGHVKIIDFGIARAKNRMEDTEQGTIKGKLRYLAPEVIDPDRFDERDFDHRIDVWAAGVILHELVAWRKLFIGEDEFAVYDAICDGDIPDLTEQGCEPALMRIIHKALARHPKVRYATAQEMADALRAHLYRRDPTFTPRRIAEVLDKVFPGEKEKEHDQDGMDGHSGLEEDEANVQLTSTQLPSMMAQTEIGLRAGFGSGSAKSKASKSKDSKSKDSKSKDSKSKDSKSKDSKSKSGKSKSSKKLKNRGWDESVVDGGWVSEGLSEEPAYVGNEASEDKHTSMLHADDLLKNAYTDGLNEPHDTAKSQDAESTLDEEDVTLVSTPTGLNPASHTDQLPHPSLEARPNHGARKKGAGPLLMAATFGVVVTAGVLVVMRLDVTAPDASESGVVLVPEAEPIEPSVVVSGILETFPLLIHTEPTGAALTLRGDVQAKKTSPAVLMVVPGETLDMEVVLSGFQTERVQIVATESEPRVHVVLKAMPVLLVVKAGPNDAITVNGARYKKGMKVLPNIELRIGVKAKGRRKASRVVQADVGKNLNIELKTQPLSKRQRSPDKKRKVSGTGFLVVTTTGKWGRVAVDGRVLDDTTPIREKLSAGTYEVVVSHPPEGKVKRFKVKIKPGRTVRKTVSF
ncbi:MAG: serine/threonine protein kinase [Deltaproteobacteria bacterium]|nr:serine/threonine protein kinase [Deltaproteobacteria bacterium]